MRIRRVGSVTCGLLLIGFGILFLLRMIIPFITFSFIFRLWPLVLVCLGIEMLVANTRSSETVLKYDMGAILLVIILAVFAMGMGLMEACIEHGAVYYHW